jgi:hypothetical protein
MVLAGCCMSRRRVGGSRTAGGSLRQCGSVIFARCMERCKREGKSQLRVFALSNLQQLTFEFVASCEVGFDAIPWLLNVREEFRHVHVIEGATNASKVGR